MISSNFIDILQSRAHHQPDAVAFTFLETGEQPQAKLTYQQLKGQAQAIAAHLQQLQLTGQRAILLYPPGLDFISAFMGCLYAGVVAVPAYPPGRERWLDRLQAVITDAQAPILLTTEPMLTYLQQRFPNILAWEHLQWFCSDRLAGQATQAWTPPQPNPEDLALLQYTSGSTATPKGVMVSHGNLMHNAEAIATAFGQRETAVVVGWLPTYHDMGLIGNVLQPLYLGRPCYLMPPASILQQPWRWLQAISQYQATISGGPNFIYDLCVRKVTAEQRSQLDLSSWQIAFNGAEPVRAATIQSFSQTFADCGFRAEAFYPCYGMAEATLFIGGGQPKQPPEMVRFDPEAITQHQVVAQPMESATELAPKLVACGKAWLDQQLTIVDPQTRQHCDAEQIGEIWVSGSSVAQGYWQDAKRSQATFQALTASGEGPYLRTGDLGFLRAGQLYITGRLKDLIIIRGRNYYPQDIELAVQQSHPALRPEFGAAFSVEVAHTERVVVIHEVERRFLRNCPVEEILTAIRHAVLDTCELQAYSIVLLRPATLPKTSSGKVQRHACRAAYLDQTLEVIAQWHATPQEHELQQLRTDVEQLWQWLMNQTQPESPNVSNQVSNLNNGVAAVDLGTTSSKITVSKLRAWLVARMALFLDVSPEAIDTSQPLSYYSLDSAVAIQFTEELMEWLGCAIEPTLFWQDFTLETLSQYLMEQHVQLAVCA